MIQYHNTTHVIFHITYLKRIYPNCFPDLCFCTDCVIKVCNAGPILKCREIKVGYINKICNMYEDMACCRKIGKMHA